MRFFCITTSVENVNSFFLVSAKDDEEAMKECELTPETEILSIEEVDLDSESKVHHSFCFIDAP